MWGRYTRRVREELRSAITEDHTPREIAGSFAVGTFITMLPTLGTGFLLFVLIIVVTRRVSKLALFASVLVFNPVVKWGVYVASLTLGVLLLGPVEGVSIAEASLDAGQNVVVRLLVGNVILAVLATILSYAVVYRLVVRYRDTAVADVIDETLEEITEEILVE
ncbi:MAG: DUF2062 domain-containing protein [Haloarculaceae archaeon]